MLNLWKLSAFGFLIISFHILWTNGLFEFICTEKGLYKPYIHVYKGRKGPRVHNSGPGFFDLQDEVDLYICVNGPSFYYYSINYTDGQVFDSPEFNVSVHMCATYNKSPKWGHNHPTVIKKLHGILLMGDSEDYRLPSLQLLPGPMWNYNTNKRENGTSLIKFGDAPCYLDKKNVRVEIKNPPLAGGANESQYCMRVFGEATLPEEDEFLRADPLPVINAKCNKTAAPPAAGAGGGTGNGGGGTGNAGGGGGGGTGNAGSGGTGNAGGGGGGTGNAGGAADGTGTSSKRRRRRAEMYGPTSISAATTLNGKRRKRKVAVAPAPSNRVPISTYSSCTTTAAPHDGRVKHGASATTPSVAAIMHGTTPGSTYSSATILLPNGKQERLKREDPPPDPNAQAPPPPPDPNAQAPPPDPNSNTNTNVNAPPPNPPAAPATPVVTTTTPKPPPTSIELGECSKLPVLQTECEAGKPKKDHACNVFKSMLGASSPPWPAGTEWRQPVLDFIVDIFGQTCAQVPKGLARKVVNIVKYYLVTALTAKAGDPKREFWKFIVEELEVCKKARARLYFSGNAAEPGTAKFLKSGTEAVELSHYLEEAENEFAFNWAIDMSWKIFSTVLGICTPNSSPKKASISSRFYTLFLEDFLNPINATWVEYKDNLLFQFLLGEFIHGDTESWINNCMEASFIESGSGIYRPLRPILVNDLLEDNYFLGSPRGTK